MSASRKLKRKMTNPKPVTGYDVTKAKATDIAGLDLSSEDNSLTIRLQLPIGNDEAHAEYEELLNMDEAPGYLQDAARQLSQAALRAVRERAFTDRPMPCATCTGACCGRHFSAVCVTGEDIERMQAGGVDIKANVKVYETERWTGYAGEMRLVPWGDEDEEACPFLEDTGCGIYEHRPRICREYSAWTCEIYEEDPAKVDGKVRLRVL